jgi:hypothetical protein
MEYKYHCMSDVLTNPDLVGKILAGNIGPSAFAAASLVSKGWSSVCRADERVLRGVARYQGGVTKTVLMRLFAVSPHEADTLPRTSHKRYGGGTYFLYSEAAIDAILAYGGIQEWQKRLRSRGASPCLTRRQLQPSDVRRAFQREERLHTRAVQRHRRGFRSDRCRRTSMRWNESRCILKEPV